MLIATSKCSTEKNIKSIATTVSLVCWLVLFGKYSWNDSLGTFSSFAQETIAVDKSECTVIKW